MRSWIATVFVFLLFVVLIGLNSSCSQNDRVEKLRLWMKPSNKIKILSTTVQIGDLVEEIGGDRIDHLVLIQGELDPHSYELVKGDDEKFSRANLIFYNGLGLEHGASLHATLRAHSSSINLGAQIQQKQPEKILKKQGLIDPHIWVDLSLWKEAIDPILEKLIYLDPEGTLFYQQRAEQLKEKMGALHEKMYSLLQQVPSKKRFLVTSHDAFHYFTKSYLADLEDGDSWEERFAAPEGLAPDGQLNPVDIEAIVQYLRKKNISVIFPESNVSRDSIKKIVSAGLELGLHISICSEVLYGDAMGGGEHHSYFDSMFHNAEVIAKYLGE